MGTRNGPNIQLVSHIMIALGANKSKGVTVKEVVAASDGLISERTVRRIVEDNENGSFKEIPFKSHPKFYWCDLSVVQPGPTVLPIQRVISNERSSVEDTSHSGNSGGNDSTSGSNNEPSASSQPELAKLDKAARSEIYRELSGSFDQLAAGQFRKNVPETKEFVKHLRAVADLLEWQINQAMRKEAE